MIAKSNTWKATVQLALVKPEMTNKKQSNEEREPSREEVEFPPDCKNGECKQCRRCYADYIEAKFAGELSA